jgi:hypothetical protein
MRKRLAKIGAMGAAATAVAALSLSMTAGTAGANSICDDGWAIYWAYSEGGYNASTWAMLETLALNGCY